MASVLDTLVKLVLRHDDLTGTLAQGFVEHARLLLSLLEHCARDGCSSSATVRNQALGIRCCDACAARLIVKSQKNIGSDADLDMNIMRGLVAREEEWVDLPNAVAIRRAQDLVTFADRGIEPDVPERGSSEWQ